MKLILLCWLIYLAMLLAYVTLRVLNPVTPINPCWCEEPVSLALMRLIDALNPDQFTMLDQPHLLDLWFACYLPLIKIQLISAANTVENIDRMIDTVIKICDRHVSDQQVKLITSYCVCYILIKNFSVSMEFIALKS